MNIIKKIHNYVIKGESPTKMLQIGDSKIPQVQAFKYIRHVLTEDGLCKNVLGEGKIPSKNIRKRQSTFL